MWKKSALAMKTDQSSYMISSDFQELVHATNQLFSHMFTLGLGLGFGFGASFFQWIASVAAIYLLVLDKTNWKTNILTSLLIPYIFCCLPYIAFHLLRGDIGKWIAFVAMTLRLFFPKHFPDWLELPASLILLIVVAPSLVAYNIRDSFIGIVICLGIGCYLLQEHIRACGGFRNSFTKANGISNSIGITILVVFPVWALIFEIL